MINKILWLPILVLSLSFSQATFANSERHSQHVCMHNIFEELNLTPDQKAKMKVIKHHAKAPLKVKWQEKKAVDKQLKAMVHAKNVDEAKLNTLINQKKEIIGSIVKIKFMVGHQVYNLLDAKQKEMFKAKMSKCEAKRLDSKKQNVLSKQNHSS